MPRGVFCSGAGARRWGGGGWLGGAAGRCAEPLRERLLIFISQISRRGNICTFPKADRAGGTVPRENFELYLCSVKVFGLGSIFRRLTYVIFLHTLTYGVFRTHFVLRFNVQIR